MESYLIIFLKTHLKYWWIYLVSILVIERFIQDSHFHIH